MIITLDEKQDEVFQRAVIEKISRTPIKCQTKSGISAFVAR